MKLLTYTSKIFKYGKKYCFSEKKNPRILDFLEFQQFSKRVQNNALNAMLQLYAYIRLYTRTVFILPEHVTCMFNKPCVLNCFTSSYIEF